MYRWFGRWEWWKRKALRGAWLYQGGVRAPDMLLCLTQGSVNVPKRVPALPSVGSRKIEDGDLKRGCHSSKFSYKNNIKIKICFFLMSIELKYESFGAKFKKKIKPFFQKVWQFLISQQ